MTSHVQNRKIPQNLFRINSKVAGYKINAQKSVACLYINNEQSEKEIKMIISFTIAWKRIKYSRINQGSMYADNYKTFWKKLKKIQLNGKTAHFMDWKMLRC